MRINLLKRTIFQALQIQALNQFMAGKEEFFARFTLF
jgi:hypothetical protein